MRIVCALSSGSAAAVACGIVLSAVFGGLGSWIAWVVLAAGGLAAWGTLRSVKSDPLPRPGFWDYLVLGVFTWAAFRAFFWLYYPDGGVLKVLSPHNLGDLSLHLGLIRYFAGGIAFWPPNPLLVGVPLTYPPGADFFNALLVSAGWDVRGSLVAVGFVWALAAGWALWRYGGAFCVAAFLFGGGLAGFAIFRTGEFLEYGSGGTWKNAFLTMLVTQRGFLFALPAGLALLWSWRKDFAPDASSPRIPLLFQVLLYATMPLFQVHAFVFLSAVLAFAVPANPRGWRAPVRLAAWAFVPAAACMAVVTDRFTAGGALRWDPFWTLEPGGLSGFLLEFGVAVFLAVWLLAALVKSGDRAGLWMAGVPALVAVLAFLVPVTDWAWDNTKFLIWAWVAAAPVLWVHVVRPLPWRRGLIHAMDTNSPSVPNSPTGRCSPRTFPATRSLPSTPTTTTPPSCSGSARSAATRDTSRATASITKKPSKTSAASSPRNPAGATSRAPSGSTPSPCAATKTPRANPCWNSSVIAGPPSPIQRTSHRHPGAVQDVGTPENTGAREGSG